jgi:hypothetical protein
VSCFGIAVARANEDEPLGFFATQEFRDKAPSEKSFDVESPFATKRSQFDEQRYD